MITKVAFVAHPVKDMAAARKFYGEVLGLTAGADFGGAWVEFSTADGVTVALDTYSAKESEHAKGYLALETDDLEADLKKLREAGTFVARDAWINHDPEGKEVCRMAIVLDPDGNPLMLHQTPPGRAV